MQLEAREVRVGDILLEAQILEEDGPMPLEVEEVYWPPIPNAIAFTVKDPPEDPPQYRCFHPKTIVEVKRLPGPDCFAHLNPEKYAECFERTSCPRKLACSE